MMINSKLQPTAIGPRQVVVVGAGIIGVCCALYLRRDGHNVTLLDRLSPGEGCSYGNAGLLARSSIAPMADPSTFVKIPGWLFKSDGPLSIRWSYLPKLTPWLIRFIQAGLNDRANETSKALHLLTDSCVDSYKNLAQQAGRVDLVRPSDYLQVYRSEKSFCNAASDFAMRRDFGFKIDEINKSDIQSLEPALSRDYNYGYRIADHGYTVDPEALVKVLAEMFVKEGGVFKRADVLSFDVNANGPDKVVTDAGTLDCDTVVIAAGALSKKMVSQLGAKVPLDTERGYHVTVHNPEIEITRPIMEGDAKFLVTPMTMGIRFAGTVELGGVIAPPNPKRIKLIENKAKQMFPDINLTKTTSWMGFRPSIPDSLPVIGPSPKMKNVFFAFGHQHIGLTSGPQTGRIISDYISARLSNWKVDAFRADRF
jgi:D-amino-acid dehydrogenase